MRLILQSILMLLITTVIAGIIYPIFITGIAQLAWHKKSQGSLIKIEDEVIGSELIAQQFLKPHYFHPRPSASNFSALPSGASNRGPTSAELAKNIGDRKDALSAQNGLNSSEIPMDLATSSASGLDPHISLQGAKAQINRIARARALSSEQKLKLEKLVNDHREYRLWGIFGQERINVLKLNLNLDKLFS